MLVVSRLNLLRCRKLLVLLLGLGNLRLQSHSFFFSCGIGSQEFSELSLKIGDLGHGCDVLGLELCKNLYTCVFGLNNTLLLALGPLDTLLRLLELSLQAF